MSKTSGKIRVVSTTKKFDDWTLDSALITMDSADVRMGDKEEDSAPPEGGSVIRYNG